MELRGVFGEEEALLTQSASCGSKPARDLDATEQQSVIDNLITLCRTSTEDSLMHHFFEESEECRCLP